MWDLKTIIKMNKSKPVEIDREELNAGLEMKFRLWLTLHGAFMNFMDELKKVGLSYDVLINIMTDYYLFNKDNYNDIIAFAFKWKGCSIYGEKYWSQLAKEWRIYSKW